MIIPGYAYTKNEDEESRDRDAIYNRVKEVPGIEIDKTPDYGKTHFTGKLTTPEAQALSEFELAMFADHGSCCFGAACTKDGDRFSGYYWVD